MTTNTGIAIHIDGVRHSVKPKTNLNKKDFMCPRVQGVLRRKTVTLTPSLPTIETP